MKHTLYWIIAAVLVASLVGAYAGGRAVGYRKGSATVSTQTDTVQVVHVDTVEVEKLRTVEHRTVDTVRIVTEHRDTVFLPWEQLVYADSTYRAVVSGYRPSLDSLTIYPRTVTQYITTTQTKETVKKLRPKWSIGLQAGYGVAINPASNAMTDGVYIGVGLSYNIISFGYR